MMRRWRCSGRWRNRSLVRGDDRTGRVGDGNRLLCFGAQEESLCTRGPTGKGLGDKRLEFKQQDKRRATEEDAFEWRLSAAQARIDMIKIAALDHRSVWSFSPTHERGGSSRTSSIDHSKTGSCEYKAGITGAGTIRCACPSNKLPTGTSICKAEDSGIPG